jgi:hypothetical protein
MRKKCPPGVLCIENISLVLLFIILLVLGFFVYTNMKQSSSVNVETTIGSGSGGWINNFIPSWPYNNLPKDVLLDPYVAPYRDERYIVSRGISGLSGMGASVPINVQTNIGATPVDTAYRQLGIITPLNGDSKDNILPLMGRPLFTNKDKWQYYTISNQHNNVKLPISFKGRSALDEYGVDKIFNGDTVYVEGYNDAFKTTVYENDTIRYLPFV